MSYQAKIGDTVRYYNYTSCRFVHGTVTKVNVPVRYLAKLPLGVEIDGSLTRAYGQSVMYDGFELIGTRNNG